MVTRFEVVIKREGGTVARGASASLGAAASTTSAAAAAKREADQVVRVWEGAGKSASKGWSAGWEKSWAKLGDQATKAYGEVAKTISALTAEGIRESNRLADQQIKDAKRVMDAQIKASKDALAAQRQQERTSSFASFGDPSSRSGSGIAGLDRAFAGKLSSTLAFEKELNASFERMAKAGEKADRDAIRSKEKAAAEELKTQQSIERALDGYREDRLRKQLEAQRKAHQQFLQQQKDEAAALARRKALETTIFSKAGGALTSIGYGAWRGAGDLAGGAAGAARTIGQGGVTNVLSTAPRAAGQLLQSAGQAAAEFSRGFAVALGKVLPGALGVVGKAIGNAFAVAGELAGALGAAAGEIAGFIGDKLGLALKATLGAAVAAGVAGIHRALEGEDIKEFFATFVEQAGQEVPAALESLRKATRGMISDLDLMRQHNEAVVKEAALTTQEFEKLAQASIPIAKAIGQRPAQALSTVTQALATFRTRGLRGLLGATADFETAFKQMADATGRHVGDLTRAEKHQIAYGVVMDAVRKKFGDYANAAENTSDKFDRWGATMANLLDKIGQPFLQGLGRLLDAVQPVSDAFGAFLSRNLVSVADDLASAIGKIDLSNIANFLKGASFKSVFELAALEGQKMWVAFKNYGQATIDVIGDWFQSLWDDVKGWGLSAMATIADVLSGILSAIPGASLVTGLMGTAGHGLAAEAHTDATNRRGRAGAVFEAASGTTGRETAAIDARIAELIGQEIAKGISNSAGGHAATLRSIEEQAGAVSRGERPGARPGGAPAPSAGGGSVTGSGVDPKAQAVFDRLAATITTGTFIVEKGLSSLIPVMNKIGVDWTKVEEGFQKIADDAAFEDAADKIKDGLKAQISAAEFQADAAQKIISELGSEAEIRKNYIDGIRKAQEDELRAREEIAQKFAQSADAIVENFKSVIDGIGARVSEASDALSSAAGIGGPFGGADIEAALPGVVKRAAKKRTRRATRDLRHELNQASAGQGADELAAPGGLEGLFSKVAQSQVLGKEGGAVQAANAAKEALNALSDAANTRDAAEAEAFDTMTQTITDLTDLANKQLETFETAVDTMNEMSRKIDELKKAQEEQNKTIDAIRSGVTRG